MLTSKLPEWQSFLPRSKELKNGCWHVLIVLWHPQVWARPWLAPNQQNVAEVIGHPFRNYIILCKTPSCKLPRGSAFWLRGVSGHVGEVHVARNFGLGAEGGWPLNNSQQKRNKTIQATIPRNWKQLTETRSGDMIPPPAESSDGNSVPAGLPLHGSIRKDPIPPVPGSWSTEATE